MRTWHLILVACTAACGSAPPEPVATPAAAHDVVRRPVRAPKEATRESSVSNVNVAPEIALACKMPTPHFAFDSAALEPDAGLDALAACFTTGPLKGRKMSLVGHTDPRGETEYNFALGQRRAGGVQAYLTLHGMQMENIATSSRGELDATGTDEATWVVDRRVDVLLGD